ncbi:MAG: hypothetical protein JJE22_04025 [Bacteroidia bacterium]|nr:hypothetical protein [Bacteroidia bacterium]
MSKGIANKIVIIHPRTGTEKKLDSNIYLPIKSAIIQSLKKSKDKTFTQLKDDVIKIIRKKIPGFKGSISWYTISVLLDLETTGIVESFIEKGKKLNRLSHFSLKNNK